MSVHRGWRGRDPIYEQIPSSKSPDRWEVICLKCGIVLQQFNRRIKLVTKLPGKVGGKPRHQPRAFYCSTCGADRWPHCADTGSHYMTDGGECYALRRIGLKSLPWTNSIPLDEIIQGDSTSVLGCLPPAIVNLTVTSPPYGGLRRYKGFAFDCRATARELFRVTKRGGAVCWVVGDETLNGSKKGEPHRQVQLFLEAGFRLHDTIIYVKDSWAFPHPARYYPAFEYVFVFSKGAPSVFNPISDRPNKQAGSKIRYVRGRQQSGEVKKRSKQLTIAELGRRTNVWVYSPGYAKSTTDRIAYKHPAIMPEALAQDLILSFSNSGQLVLDPFAGAGTSCKMAALGGRKWLGIEISPEYCAIARQRVALSRPSFDAPLEQS